MEVGFGELHKWAEKVADKTNSEELWDTLMKYEARIARLEERLDDGDSEAGEPSARTDTPLDSRVTVIEAKVAALEGLLSDAQGDIERIGKRIREERTQAHIRVQGDTKRDPAHRRQV